MAKIPPELYGKIIKSFPSYNRSSNIHFFLLTKQKAPLSKPIQICKPNINTFRYILFPIIWPPLYTNNPQHSILTENSQPIINRHD